jgi:hypothetical protein
MLGKSLTGLGVRREGVVERAMFGALGFICAAVMVDNVVGERGRGGDGGVVVSVPISIQ